MAGETPHRPPNPDTRYGEKISLAQFVRRVEQAGQTTSHSSLNNYRMQGILTRTLDKKFVWPHCMEDLKKYRDATTGAYRSARSDRGTTRNKPAQYTGETPEEQPPETEVVPIDPAIAKTISPNDLNLPSIVLQLSADLRALKGTALGGTFQYARTYNELIKAEKSQTEMLVRKGELVDRKKVEEMARLQASYQRNIWLNLPERIAVEFAEEAGIDRRLAYDLSISNETLESYVASLQPKSTES